MGTVYIGTNVGAGPDATTVGASTTSKDIQLVYDDTKALTKQNLMLAMEKFEIFIGQMNMPPV